MCLAGLPYLSFGQQAGYFQQRVDVSLQVKLDAGNKTLDGFASFTYTNNSPDTLTYIWFHLWPNAYKNDRTAFSEQMLKTGRTDFYFSDEEQRGYINKLNFSVNGTVATLEDHPLYIDVARLVLPLPLLPGETIKIETPFHEKIPYLFSRSGYTDNFFLIAQWFPKPAVYDRKGWHPMPYLDQGEFYSEFGDYEVTISIPKDYQLAATGRMTESRISGETKTITFKEENLHDFAWTAARDLIIDSSEIVSTSGKSIKLFSLYGEDDFELWQNSLRYIKETVRFREEHIGPYPYSTITIVAAPAPFEGGMEYPGFTTIQKVEDSLTLIELIDHEVGHNWFYGALASNERDFAWMDEGMNSFYTHEFMRQKMPDKADVKKGFFGKRMPDNPDRFIYNLLLSEKKDQRITLSSSEFSAGNYYALNYYKAAAWMERLKEFTGDENFRSIMRTYYSDWRFKHPYPDDFKDIVNKIAKQDTDSIFNILYSHQDVMPAAEKKLKVGSFFNLNEQDRYRYLFLSPAVGANNYDGFMAGLLFHNYSLPNPPFHFLLAPMYGTGSNSLTGLARLGYTFSSYGKIRKIEPAIAASTFNVRKYVDSTGKKNFMDFSKVVPSLRLTFRNDDPLSRSEKFLQWKTYFITETGINFQRDTIYHVNVITYPKNSRYLNELAFENRNEWALYPFSYRAMAQQSDGFVRLTAEARQHFNYKNEGGLNARLFGGKMIYTDNTTPRWMYRRYQFNMTGANGFEDYTYSNYFIGRNEFEGAASQQIMIRDGGFKVRTDLLNNKVGTSDDWLVALNLNTDIPRKLNPLSILPVDIKLKAFLDIGTYSGAWQKGSDESKFLFDAGLQLNLLSDLVKIYIPLLYSKQYGDYFKSTIPKNKRFWQTISFSIDIQNFKLNDILKFPY